MRLTTFVCTPSVFRNHCLLIVVACGVFANTGCRQVPRRADSPTPRTDLSTPAADPWHGPQSNGPQLTHPSGAPAIPPVDDDSALPPLPGVSANGQPRIGGFTQPWYAVTPEPGVQFTQFDVSTTQPIQRVADTQNSEPEIANSPIELPSLEPFEPLAELLAETTTDSAADHVTVPVLLKPDTVSVVDLDREQFVIALQDEDLSTATTSPTTVTLTPAFSFGFPLAESLPATTSGVSVPEWSASGIPFDMVILPGPNSRKWSPSASAEIVNARRNQEPRRLADHFDARDLRRIQ